MAQRGSSSDVRLDVSVGTVPRPPVPDPETPFRILVMADFGGAARGGKPIRVDRDNFEDVVAHFAPRIDIGGQDAPPIQIHEMEDFHPDRLWEKSALFASLRQLRAELLDPERTSLPVGRPVAPPDASSLLASTGLLDSILDEEAPEAAAPVRQRDPLRSYIDRAIEPYLEAKPGPEQEKMIAKLDEAIADQLRAVLHHPRFQAIEAAWRSLFFLIRRLDTDGLLNLYAMDISKEEVTADLRRKEGLKATKMYDLLIRSTPKGTPWAAVAGDYSFSTSTSDIDLLARLALLSAQAGVPFLAGAQPTVLGVTSLLKTDDEDWQNPSNDENWRTLREMPESSYLCLGLPRFLLRLPYGEETDATEAFPLEEMPRGPKHSDYLWGNPAFVCAWAIGEGFEEEGWNLLSGRHHDLEGLPLHVARVDGDSVATPCAETLLPESAMNALLEYGLTPLVSRRDSDMVRVMRLQSLASPARLLAGRWQ
jgi:type VI secretion system protein ImpC